MITHECGIVFDGICKSLDQGDRTALHGLADWYEDQGEISYAKATREIIVSGREPLKLTKDLSLYAKSEVLRHLGKWAWRQGCYCVWEDIVNSHCGSSLPERNHLKFTHIVGKGIADTLSLEPNRITLHVVYPNGGKCFISVITYATCSNAYLALIRAVARRRMNE